MDHTAQGSPNPFFCSVKHYGHFELEFDVQCDRGLNSGAPTCSPTKTNRKQPDKLGRVYRPQVEIESNAGSCGYTYGESAGLGWLSPEPKSNDKKIKPHSLFKNDGRSHCHVIARGLRIRPILNGHPVAALTHEGIYKQASGVRGHQARSIKPAVWVAAFYSP